MTTTIDRPSTSTESKPAAQPLIVRAIDAMLATEKRVLDLLRIISVPALRVALAAVYIWFGILKIVGASPIADLVAAMVPFLPANLVVTGLGIAEVVLGTALLVGVAVPWIAAAQVVHLLSTFAVFVVYPAVVFDNGNPFTVTLEGEFIAKNLVLVAGLLVVAAFSGRKR